MDREQSKLATDWFDDEKTSFIPLFPFFLSSFSSRAAIVWPSARRLPLVAHRFAALCFARARASHRGAFVRRPVIAHSRNAETINGISTWAKSISPLRVFFPPHSYPVIVGFFSFRHFAFLCRTLFGERLWQLLCYSRISRMHGMTVCQARLNIIAWAFSRSAIESSQLYHLQIILG